MKKMIWMTCLAGLFALTGCAYYQVTDPASGKVFYTQDINREKGGAVRIRDAGTGDEVTLQNSQIKKVSQEEFESKSGKK